MDKQQPTRVVVQGTERAAPPDVGSTTHATSLPPCHLWQRIQCRLGDDGLPSQRVALTSDRYKFTRVETEWFLVESADTIVNKEPAFLINAREIKYIGLYPTRQPSPQGDAVKTWLASLKA